MDAKIKTKLDEIARKSVPILKRNGVTRAFIFGSLLRGDDISSSDIDFLVDYKEGISLLDAAGLKIELEKVLNRKVDLVSAKFLNKHLKSRVLKERFSIL